MLTHDQIEKSRTALSKAAIAMGGSKIGSMVFSAQVRVCLFLDERKLIDREAMPARFIYDTNLPKFFLDRFQRIDFYTEFSVGWQEMTFMSKSERLVVKGRHHQTGANYKVHLHLRNARAVRGV